MNNFDKIANQKFSRIIACPFFQYVSSSFENVSVNPGEGFKDTLFLDVLPAADQPVILNHNEKKYLYRQLQINHIVEVEAQEFTKLYKSFQPNHELMGARQFDMSCGLGTEGINQSIGKKFAELTEKNQHLEIWSQYLGYYYPLTGKVVYGNQVGRTMGFPTINLDPFDKNKIIPPQGVYAGWLHYDRKWYGCMINIGMRPTLNKESFTIEAHVFNFEDEVYGKTVTLCFAQRIRDEQRFSSLEVLKKQLIIDKNKTVEILRDLKTPEKESKIPFVTN
ncbi:MAG: riboflavin kinase [Bacteroidales bacterium]